MKWVAFIRDEFTPILVQLIYDGSHLEQHKMTLNLESAFAELNNGKCEHGKHGRYFLGNQFTLVDVYLIPSLLLVDVAKFFRGITIGTVHSHLLSYSQAMHSFSNYAPVRLDLDSLKGAVAQIHGWESFITLDSDDSAATPKHYVALQEACSSGWHATWK